MFACSVCDRLCGSVNDLGGHMIYFHQTSSSDHYLCFYCKKSFTSLFSYKTHVSKHHPRGSLPVVGNNNDNGLNDQFVDIYANNEGENVANDAEEIIDEDNQNLENDIQDNEISLDQFVRDLYDNVTVHIAQLYANPNVNRQAVGDIVTGTSELLSKSVTSLRTSVLQFISSFQDVPENYADDLFKIKSMFDTLENSFEFMSTEHKRLDALSMNGCFVPPIRFEMGEIEVYEKVHGSIELVNKTVYGQMIPLRNVLKKFLEMPGAFNDIMNYMTSLDNESSRKTNFVQGDLWKKCRASFDKDEIVIPIHLHFDDYEPDNALGSHHTDHSVGALYASIPSLPPCSQSHLENMFLFTVFESKYRKMFGNEKAFSKAIDEIIFLEREGITIDIDGRSLKVRFCCPLIIADNLGYNQILGFVESYTGNFFCRMCKLHRDEMKVHCTSVPPDKMRTVENYSQDVEVNDLSLTGVSEECVFNKMPSYHCIINSHCEIQHDYYEGTLRYDICNILYYLIGVREYFSLDLFVERIDGFDYGPNEKGNKPPTVNLTLTRLENCTWNLSSVEMLCLARYLGEMIGDLVPEGNPIWKFYIKVREILHIVTAPHVDDGMEVYLKTLIAEHHELYLLYFGNLKPKHHLQCHHPDCLKNGPMASSSSLLCERTHRKGKVYAKVCNSRVNFPFSVAVKFQLSLSERLMRKGQSFHPTVKTSGVMQVPASNFECVAPSLPFQPSELVSVAKSVQISGTLYCVNSILVVEVGDLLPRFGKVVNIILEDCRNVIFIVNLLTTECYIDHINAYVVTPTLDSYVIRHNNLVDYVPLWERNFNGNCVVSLKHVL